jgi:outer membrane protein assembly factor BamB
LKTGKVMWRTVPEWQETVTVNGSSRTIPMSTYRGTLLYVDGKFLCIGETGSLLWLDLSPKGYKELARTQLFLARETWSSPVLSRGLLYISQHSRDFASNAPPRLLCYDLRGEGK